jgi:general secretion pathway protein K
MALLITLAAISFLIALTVQLATSVNWQIQASTNQKDAVRLNAALHSGLSLVRAALYADQQEDKSESKKNEKFDSLQDAWNTFDMDLINGLVGGEGLSLIMRDMSGRIQVNRLWLSDEELKAFKQEFKKDPANKDQTPPDLLLLQRDLWKRFLTSGKFAVEDEDEALSLIDALSDWLDADDEERDHGAEQGYYLSLGSPYVSRNGSLQYLEELLLVKGFSRKIVYGDGEYEGIIDYLTIYGKDGKMNINTAPSPVLRALAENIDEEMVEKLVEFRRDPDNLDALQEQEWYKRVDGLAGVSIDDNLITTESSFFSCTITAGRNGLQQTGKGFIYRDPETHEQTLLSWKVE